MPSSSLKCSVARKPLFMSVLVGLDDPKFSRPISQRIRNASELNSMHSLALRYCSGFTRKRDHP